MRASDAFEGACRAQEMTECPCATSADAIRDPSSPVEPVRKITMALGIDATRDILLPGIAAGLLSTAALGVCARLHGKHAAAPVSAVSHWLWPQEVNQTAHPKPRHFVAGLTIHLLMSLG